MKRCICVLLSLALLFCIGCGGGSGARSPEDAFKGWTEAAGKEDFKAWASHMTRDSQSAMAGWLLIELSNFVPMDKQQKGNDEKDRIQAVESLLKRHGLTLEAIDNQHAKASEAPDNKAVAREFIVLGEMAKDRIAFLDDALKTLKKLAPLEKNPLEGLSTGKLKDVKINGDTATGTATATIAGTEKTDPAHFRKEDGGWKIDLIPELEAKGWDALRN